MCHLGHSQEKRISGLNNILYFTSADYIMSLIERSLILWNNSGMQPWFKNEIITTSFWPTPDYLEEPTLRWNSLFFFGHFVHVHTVTNALLPCSRFHAWLRGHCWISMFSLSSLSLSAMTVAETIPCSTSSSRRFFALASFARFFSLFALARNAAAAAFPSFSSSRSRSRLSSFVLSSFFLSSPVSILLLLRFHIEKYAEDSRTPNIVHMKHRIGVDIDVSMSIWNPMVNWSVAC